MSPAPAVGEKRDPERIPVILAELDEIWSARPDMRLGQLIANVVRDRQYYIEDEELIAALREAYSLPKDPPCP